MNEGRKKIEELKLSDLLTALTHAARIRYKKDLIEAIQWEFESAKLTVPSYRTIQEWFQDNLKTPPRKLSAEMLISVICSYESEHLEAYLLQALKELNYDCSPFEGLTLRRLAAALSYCALHPENYGVRVKKEVPEKQEEHHLLTIEPSLCTDMEKRVLWNMAIMPAVELPPELPAWLGCASNALERLLHNGWIIQGEHGYRIHTEIAQTVKQKLQGNDLNQPLLGLLGRDDTPIFPRDLPAEFARFRTAIMVEWLGNCQGEPIPVTDGYLRLSAVLHQIGDYQMCQVLLIHAERTAGRIEDTVERQERLANIALVRLEVAQMTEKPTILEDEYIQETFERIEQLKRIRGAENHELNFGAYLAAGQICDREQEYELAQQYLQKAIDAAEQGFGRKSSYYTIASDSLAVAWLHMGNHGAALRQFLNSLEIYLEIEGGQSPATAICYHNISAALAPESTQFAGVYEEKAYQIFLRVCGESHPYTMACRKNLQLWGIDGFRVQEGTAE